MHTQDKPRTVSTVEIIVLLELAIGWTFVCWNLIGYLQYRSGDALPNAISFGLYIVGLVIVAYPWLLNVFKQHG